jgi:hypothetical protein
MDSFEQVVAAILERQGYWTRTAFKVDLTPEDKKAIDRPSSPRWELDIVGYRGKDNRLIVLECKSFFDSLGVRAATFLDREAYMTPKDSMKYKLFFNTNLRRVVFRSLRKQLVKDGSCAPWPKLSFGLAAGKINGDERLLAAHFKKKRWELWTPSMIRHALSDFSKTKYENNIAAVVTKILLRENKAPKR